MLPFVNNLWTTSLTGAQLKTLLEQQWQTNADGTVPSRAYQQLGLSKNVNYTYDAARAAGDRITSIRVNGSLIDPAKSYRIGTFSFLATGGDNFRVFTQGTGTKDSGLVDRDAWIGYLQKSSPVAPDFARRSVAVANTTAAEVKPGEPVTLAVSKLDLTSLGSPVNTSLTAVFTDAAGKATQLGTVPVAAGAASRQPAGSRRCCRRRCHPGAHRRGIRNHGDRRGDGCRRHPAGAGLHGTHRPPPSGTTCWAGSATASSGSSTRSACGADPPLTPTPAHLRGRALCVKLPGRQPARMAAAISSASRRVRWPLR